jgi:hypothetical protein
VKPNITVVEVHPRLSNNEHPVDGTLVSAGGVKISASTDEAHLVYNMPLLLPSKLTAMDGAFKSPNFKRDNSESLGPMLGLLISYITTLLEVLKMAHYFLSQPDTF